MSNLFRRIAILPGAWLSPSTLAQITALSQKDVVTYSSWPPPDNAGPSDVDAIVCGWEDRLPISCLRLFPALRYIGVRGTSTDHIDIAYATKNTIAVRPICNYGNPGTVEFVIEQMLYDARQRRRDRGLAVTELHGKRLGLLGYGNVGSRVGRAAAALGMRVLYYTPTVRSTTEQGNPAWAALDDVLLAADMLSIHTPAYRLVMSIDDLRYVHNDALVVITTLGLPFPSDDFVNWQRNRGGRVVLDQCAVQGVPQSVCETAGVEVAGYYAARTEESILRAEQAMLDNLRAASHDG